MVIQDVVVRVVGVIVMEMVVDLNSLLMVVVPLKAAVVVVVVVEVR